MLQQFWSYFMTTGNIDTYMHFKEYEREYYSHSTTDEPPKHTDEVG